MSSFWIPRYKYQLVEWLNKYDPSGKWERMKRKQLLAIYINLRKKGACIHVKTSVDDRGDIVIYRRERISQYHNSTRTNLGG